MHVLHRPVEPADIIIHMKCAVPSKDLPLEAVVPELSLLAICWATGSGASSTGIRPSLIRSTGSVVAVRRAPSQARNLLVLVIS